MSIYLQGYFFIMYTIYNYSALTKNTAYSVFEWQHHVWFECVHCVCFFYTHLYVEYGYKVKASKAIPLCV